VKMCSLSIREYRGILTLLRCKFCGVSDASAIWPKASEIRKILGVVNNSRQIHVARTMAPNSSSHACYQRAVLLVFVRDGYHEL